MAVSLTALGELLSDDRVLSDDAHVLAYESDGLTAFKAVPRAVVIPETSGELISVVQWCQCEGVPFVARGSGTSLSGGSLLVDEGIVIALNRLDKILDIDPVDRREFNNRNDQRADPRADFNAFKQAAVAQLLTCRVHFPR